MKRLIGVVLVLALVATGLSGIAYAQTTVNEVIASVRASWNYEVLSGDTFENGEVTGRVTWYTDVTNLGDDSGDDVGSLDVSLYSEQELTFIQDELIEHMGPPNYEWYSFSSVPEWGHVGVYAGFNSPEEMPAIFTPGFDASRIFTDDKTRFLQSEGTQVQEVTVTLTPRDTTDVGVRIQTPSCGDDIADAEIQSPGISDYFELSPDGQSLSIYPDGLEIAQTWEATIEIAVTPNVPAIDFRPYVAFGPLPTPEPIVGEPITSSSIQLDMTHMGDTLGTFMWTADGDYAWYEQDFVVQKQVTWRPGCAEVPLIPATPSIPGMTPWGIMATVIGLVVLIPLVLRRRTII